MDTNVTRPVGFTEAELQAAGQRREQKIREYEGKFGISSEEFLKLWAVDKIEDTYETNHWAMLLERP